MHEIKLLSIKKFLLCLFLFPLSLHGETTRESLQPKIQHYAYKYGVDSQLAQSIINCESGFKPHSLNVNKSGSRDYSFFQINDKVWEKKLLLEHGWIIQDPEDNLEAGFFILSQEGTRPWNASSKCWQG